MLSSQATPPVKQSSVTPQIPLCSPKTEGEGGGGGDAGMVSLCGESKGDSAGFCHTDTWGYVEGSLGVAADKGYWTEECEVWDRGEREEGPGSKWGEGIYSLLKW